MLTVKEKGILECILEHCSNINEAIVSINQSDFVNNKIIQNSVCFDLLQIGELAKKFDPNFIKEYGNSPWKDIKGMRDKIVHGYDTLLIDKVWRTATEDIKPLKEYCESIIEKNT